MADLTNKTDEQLVQLRDQLEAELLEHRQGHGASRTREAAERRIQQNFADAQATLAEMVEEARNAAIVGNLDFTHRYRLADMLASQQWRDMLLEAVARPAAAGWADNLAPFTEADFNQRQDHYRRAIAELDTELELRAAREQMAAAEARIAAVTKEH